MTRLPLSAVKQLFSDWRATRKNRTEAIPDKLWSMVIELYPQYKRSFICQQLGLNGGQLRQHLEAAGHKMNSGFVVASKNSAKPEETPVKNVDIQLRLQGKERTLTVHVDVSALSQIIPHLLPLL